MLLNPGFFVLSLISSLCLFAISILLYTNHVRLSGDPYDPLLGSSQLIDLSSYLGPRTSVIPPQSLTPILPVFSPNISHIRQLLAPFLGPQDHIQEVLIVCPDTITSSVQRALQKIFTTTDSVINPEISLLFFHGKLDGMSASLSAAADSTTDWVLIMDDEGLSGLLQPVIYALLHPPNIHLPFGPSGEPIDLIHASQDSYWGDFIAAKHLRPPFVAPKALCRILLEDPKTLWAHSGFAVANGDLQTFGGLLLNGNLSNPPVLSSPELQGYQSQEPDQIVTKESGQEDTVVDDMTHSFTTVSLETTKSMYFMLLLPFRSDLHDLLPLICGMRKYEDRLLRILIYNEHMQDFAQNTREMEIEQAAFNECAVQYEVLTWPPSVRSYNLDGKLFDWIREFEHQAAIDVIICIEGPEDLTRSLLTSNQGAPTFSAATVVRIPRSDLGQTEWMSSLTLDEWRNWHLPSVDVSVITNDRPQSLQRLLHSLLNARYFGDKLNLRIYIEQNCDEETLKIVQNISWPFGNVFIHRRIVHAGLLPAIVESWYPYSNDSYGLLLEDDVELSPLFYAWVKMGILRYRYGASYNRNPILFGISLYQQKNVELSPEGRRQFNPRLLFSDAGFEFPNTPYLSQVPCSWGAVYFPEHWREFHGFLSLRLSETQMMLEDDIVPQLRSNSWSKSWKKFFIELVFLRGYVMLYPNYEDFKSFSTNHLEVGSHVKDRSREKQDLFLLPLMPLEQMGGFSQLLDIPHGTLPPINNLPVLNLTGFLTSLEEITERGYSRRFDLTLCDVHPDLYDVRSLMCTQTS